MLRKLKRIIRYEILFLLREMRGPRSEDAEWYRAIR